MLIAGRTTWADPPPLSPGGQTFVDVMTSFNTLQTAITVEPSFLGKETGTLRGVLRLRDDGAMAFDMALQNRLAFDGERFTHDRFGPGFDVTEFWPDRVDVTNQVFGAIRSNNATWLPYGPQDYALAHPNLARNDWLELKLPAMPLSGHRFFFVMKGDRPSQLWIYDATHRVRTVVFRSWVVNPPLPPEAFNPNAPPLEVDLQYTHIPLSGNL